MALSNSTNFTVTRDDIITRALRIAGTIGQGETPTATQLSEGALALNLLMKEWEADGLQLGLIQNVTIALIASTKTYSIGVGQTNNQYPPLRIIKAWTRDSNNIDVPVDVVSRDKYEDWPSKITTGGRPNVIWYLPPRNMGTGEMIGVVTIAPTPDATTVTSYPSLIVTGVFPTQDFDTGTDNPDFPQYYFNAITWGLASELAYEYGLPFAERSMIDKKAMQHKISALLFDYEEGSLFITPDYTKR